MLRLALAGAALGGALFIAASASAAPPAAAFPPAVAPAPNAAIAPAYWWHGRYYRYHWHGRYYPYYWRGRYYFHRRWHNGIWIYF